MEKVFVTKPFLPPIGEYIDKISCIWDNHILTNYGPLHKEFEEKLKKYLNLSNVHYVNNGTTALALALEALDKPLGEIITTPFTFVATANAIVWQKYKPVFVDIKSNNFNIDADKIEEKINENTRAIVAVHCFGYPCDIKKIEMIGKKNNIPIIYDAAHTFGIKYRNKSLYAQGDISIGSFHATKVFHTIEGGICIVNNYKYNDKIKTSKNFGLLNGNYEYIGINAKSSEFHAAMGLCMLNHIDEIINYRKCISNLYKSLLDDKIFIPEIPKDLEYNYIYFPIVFPNEKMLIEVINNLNSENIFPRRYFYPSLNELPIFNNASVTPISSDISKRVLCLPLDTYITEEIVTKICLIINETMNKKVYKLVID